MKTSNFKRLPVDYEQLIDEMVALEACDKLGEHKFELKKHKPMFINLKDWEYVSSFVPVWGWIIKVEITDKARRYRRELDASEKWLKRRKLLTTLATVGKWIAGIIATIIAAWVIAQLF